MISANTGLAPQYSAQFADAAKVRLCLVLDMPYSEVSEKIEEELSDYYLIKYNDDAELTFGGAI